MPVCHKRMDTAAKLYCTPKTSGFSLIHAATLDQGRLARPPLSGWLARMSVIMARSLLAWSATGLVSRGVE